MEASIREGSQALFSLLSVQFSISIFLYLQKSREICFFFHNTSVVFFVFNLYIVQYRAVRC